MYARQIFRAPLLGERAPTGANGGKTVFEDEAVRLWTLESGLGAEVLMLSIKTKVHAIGPGVINGLLKAVELAGVAVSRAWSIWSPDEPFSVGADLQAMMPVFMSGGAKAIGAEEKKLQDAYCA